MNTPEIDFKVFGNQIKELRAKKGISQRKLALLIGKSESSIRKYEIGAFKVPTVVFNKIVSELGKIPDFIPYNTLERLKVTDEILELRVKKGVTLRQLSKISNLPMVVINGFIYADRAIDTEKFSLILNALKQLPTVKRKSRKEKMREYYKMRYVKKVEKKKREEKVLTILKFTILILFLAAFMLIVVKIFPIIERLVLSWN